MDGWGKFILFYYITTHLIVLLSIILKKENLVMIYIALTIPLYLPFAINSRIKSNKEKEEMEEAINKIMDFLDDMEE